MTLEEDRIMSFENKNIPEEELTERPHNDNLINMGEVAITIDDYDRQNIEEKIDNIRNYIIEATSFNNAMKKSLDSLVEVGADAILLLRDYYFLESNLSGMLKNIDLLYEDLCQYGVLKEEE